MSKSDDKNKTPGATGAGAAGTEANAGADNAQTENDEPIVKSNFRKVKVRDFRGTYADAKFDDNCVCESISEETLDTLKKQFPGAVVEEIH